MSAGGRYEIDPVTGVRVRVEAPTRTPARRPAETAAEVLEDGREPPPAKGGGRRARKE